MNHHQAEHTSNRYIQTWSKTGIIKKKWYY